MVGAVANSPTNWKAFTNQSEVPTWCQLFYKPHASGVNLIRGGLEIHIRADVQLIGRLSVGRFASTLEAIEANYTNSLGKRSRIWSTFFQSETRQVSGCSAFPHVLSLRLSLSLSLCVSFYPSLPEFFFSAIKKKTTEIWQIFPYNWFPSIAAVRNCV